MDKSGSEINTFSENIPQEIVSYLKLVGQKELSGGLRCITKEHDLRCKVIVKQGNLEEFRKQKAYVDGLSLQFQSIFPKILYVGESENSGLMILEFIEGCSLHEYIFSTHYDFDLKCQALENSLRLLLELHQSENFDLIQFIDSNQYLDSISERINVGGCNPFEISNYVELRAKLSRQFNRFIYQARPIHGDAQCGNLIVEKFLPGSIRMIDPLGGSAKSPGDWTYDISRFFHWVASAGIAYEIENSRDFEFELKFNSYARVRSEISELVIKVLKDQAKRHSDQQAELRFWLHNAFHLSGKLNNFRQELSQSLIMAEIKNSFIEIERLLNEI
ncbi:MAG: hypothetical protein KDD25_07395 [Bdellovibrionales bacterium]|nr:hypothetical protein [Bdellovibrionales bacterium]